MDDAADLAELFHELVELAPAERERRLERMADEPALAMRLRAMLAVEEQRGTRAYEPAAPPRAYPWPGDRLHGYQLIAPIGDGGMGSVWMAGSLAAPEVTVAVKFPLASDGVIGAEARERLIQERRILAELQHPNVVPIVGAGETAAGVPYALLPLIQGRAIDAYVAERRLEAIEIIDLLGGVADALDHVHARGFVHRDVKPSNVVVTDGGRPVLVDFGAARVTAGAGIEANVRTVLGAPRTPEFASPEQNGDRIAERSSDVYSLGLVARTLLADALAPLPSAARRAVEAAIERATAAEPGKRFDAAGNLIAALRAPLRPAPELPSRGLTMAVLLACFSIGAAVWGLVLAPRFAPAAPGEFVEETLKGLTEVPALQIPIDAELLDSFARERDLVDLRVAAAVVAADHERTDLAREIAEAAHEEGWTLTDLRALELARLYTRMGFGRRALDRLNGIPPELLDLEPLEELIYLRALNGLRVRGSFQPPELFPLEGVDELDENELPEEFFEDLLAGELDVVIDDPALAVLLLLLEAGETDAMEIFLAAPLDGEYDLIQRSAVEIETLLALHARLRNAELIEAMDPGTLRMLEEEFGHREREGEEELRIRAWALARLLRAADALKDDPESARRLADAGAERLRRGAWAPVDLEAELVLVRAVADAWLDEPEAAAAGFAEARRLAVEALGEESWLAERVAELERDPEPEFLPIGPDELISDPEEWTELLHAERRSDRLWWAED